MRSFIKDGTAWTPLHTSLGGQAVEHVVSATSTCSIKIYTNHLQKVNDWDDSWISSAKEACVVSDSYDENDLNNDFDSVPKIFHGIVDSVEHEENFVTLACEDMSAQWLREPISLDDNVVYEDTVLSHNSEDKATLKDASFTTNEHVGRTAWFEQIEDSDDLKDKIVLTSTTQIYTSEDLKDGYPVITLPRFHDDGTYLDAYDGGMEIESSIDDAEFHVKFTFPILEGMYPSGKFKIILVACSGEVDDVEFESGHEFKVEILETSTSTYKEILTNDRTNTTAEKYTIDLDIKDVTKYIYNKTSIILRIWPGVYEVTEVGPTYSAWLKIKEFYIIAEKDQHDPVGFKITANTSNVLTLDVDADVVDLFTERVNSGDTVKILYKNKEWIEDQISSLAHNINSISCPSSSAATYTTMDYKTVRQNIDETCNAEKWYWYVTRKTTSGKPNIVFKEKSDPPHPTIITDNHVEKYTIHHHRLQEVRQVVVKNSDDVGKYPSSASVSNKPVLVINDPEIPTAYLEDIAQAIYNMRNSPSTTISTTARKCITCTVEFHEQDLSDWTIDAGTGTTVDVEKRGGIWALHVKDTATNANAAVYRSVTPGTVSAGTWVEWQDWTDTTAYHQYRIYGTGFSGGRIMINIQNGNVYNERSDGTDTIATGIIQTNKWNKFRVVFVSSSQFDIYINDVKYDNNGNHFTCWETFTNNAEIIMVYSGTSHTPEFATMYWAFSWMDDDGETDIQESGPNFHAGSNIIYYLAPSTKGEDDYRVVGNGVARKLTWKTDGTVDIVIGWDELQLESVDELVRKRIAKLLHVSAS